MVSVDDMEKSNLNSLEAAARDSELAVLQVRDTIRKGVCKVLASKLCVCVCVSLRTF